MDMLKLPRLLVNEILKQAQASPETEICGLISARDGHATNCYPIHNGSDQPAVRYIMEPRAQIDAMRRMRDNGEELLAIYHSHPSSAALPSATDIKEAEYPDAVYLIVSLNTTGVLEMAAFHIDKGESAQIPLELE